MFKTQSLLILIGFLAMTNISTQNKSSLSESVIEITSAHSSSLAAETESPRIFFSADPKATDCAKARESSETHFEMKGKEIVVRCFVMGTLQDKHFVIKVESHGPDFKTEKLDYNGSCLYKDITFHRRGKFYVRLITDGRDADLGKDIYIE